MGASHAIPRSEERHVQEVGLETRQATYGHVPPNTVQDSTVRILLLHQVTLFSALGVSRPNIRADQHGDGYFESPVI